MNHKPRYVPALHYRILTPLYDPLLRWGMRELRFKRRLVEAAQIAPGQQVLDVGCGTGTLSVLLKQMHPRATVVGLDGDPQILELARRKADRQAAEIRFDLGLADQLPYRSSSFDRVLSSLMIHHLATGQKQRAFAEAHRVLRPGGRLLVADFGKPDSILAAAISLVMRRFERTEDNIQGRLPEMMQSAGFEDIQIIKGFNTLFGLIVLYRASKADI